MGRGEIGSDCLRGGSAIGRFPFVATPHVARKRTHAGDGAWRLGAFRIREASLECHHDERFHSINCCASVPSLAAAAARFC
jgi:hypothetical protein